MAGLGSGRAGGPPGRDRDPLPGLTTDLTNLVKFARSIVSPDRSTCKQAHLLGIRVGRAQKGRGVKTWVKSLVDDGAGPARRFGPAARGGDDETGPLRLRREQCAAPSVRQGTPCAAPSIPVGHIDHAVGGTVEAAVAEPSDARAVADGRGPYPRIARRGTDARPSRRPPCAASPRGRWRAAPSPA